MLDLHGAVVTIEAMGCQKAIARQIVEPAWNMPVRDHWGIENGQHWVLVQFGKDANRARTGASTKNLAWVRRMTMNLIRHNGSSNL